MPRYCENALKVAQYLQKYPKVVWVNYCGLPDSQYYDLAQKGHATVSKEEKTKIKKVNR